ncbi:M4 family metallopeptidase [Streptomyces sp. NPDC026589]|uniref:M4 family metallopeptidase n=1 Tax=Streptomyces sp. NPDC026589 TaxID=3155609 RepID=UPI0034069E5A
MRRRPALKVSAAGALLASAAMLAVGLPAGAVSPAPGDRAAPASKARAGALPTKLSPEQHRNLVAAAQADRAATARALGLGSKEELRARNVLKDADGTLHTRYERTYDGLPVVGGDLVVHTSPSGAAAVSKATKSRIAVPSTTPARSAETAGMSSLSRAEKEGRRDAKLQGEPRAVVWAAGGRPVLAWESVVNSVQPDGVPSELHVITDAATGRELNRDEKVKRGTGSSMYSGQVPVGSIKSGSVYSLLDPEHGGHRTYDATNVGEPHMARLFTDTDNVWGTGTMAHPQTAAVDAAYGAQTFWNYITQVHGRNGIRNDGDGAASRVHFGTPRTAAFWQNSCFCVTFGDQNGKPHTTIDINAHEMGHGVTFETARLGGYDVESLGLDEASSDIFGTLTEFHAANAVDVGDYQIGERVNAQGDGTPLRSMDQPSRNGTGDDYWHPQMGRTQNAGPAVHWFYLASEGSGVKTLNGVSYDSRTVDGLPVTPIGRAAAEKIWYRALAVYMTSTTNYAGARTATLAAAADLYGAESATWKGVREAWGAVNVGTRSGNPAPTKPPGPVFENVTDVPIPAAPATGTSPITVTGVTGNGPSILRVNVDLAVQSWTQADLAAELVAPDGTVFPIANWETAHTESRTATFAIDATRVGANGTWKLLARDRTPGAVTAGINSWKLSF